MTASRRIVPITDNLAARLRPLARKGKVVRSSELVNQATALAAALGVEWPRNVLRHSVISYRIAIVKSADQVWLGRGMPHSACPAIWIGYNHSTKREPSWTNPHIPTFMFGQIMLNAHFPMLRGRFPVRPHSRGWVYYSRGGMGLLLVLVVVLLIRGGI